MNLTADKQTVSNWSKKRINQPNLHEQERQNIIEELNDLGFYETAGKSTKELSTKLALLKIRVESPHLSWF